MGRHAGPVLVLTRQQYGARRVRWLEARSKGLGGTDAAAAMGLSPHRTPLMVYLDKIEPDFSESMNERMFWGLKHENTVARVAGQREKLKILPSPGLLAHPGRPWQLATVDRLVLDGESDTPVPLEVKTTDKVNAKKWPADGDPPDHVVIQVQHQLSVGGWPYGYVACLVGGNDYRFWRIARNEPLIEDMVVSEITLWQRVLEQRPPEPMAGRDDETMRRLFPADPTSRRWADDSDEALIAEINSLRDEADKIEERGAELSTMLRWRLGAATELRRADGTTLATYRVHVSRQFQTTAFKRDLPNVYDRYTIRRDVRPLRVLRSDDDASK